MVHLCIKYYHNSIPLYCIIIYNTRNWFEEKYESNSLYSWQSEFQGYTEKIFMISTWRLYQHLLLRKLFAIFNSDLHLKDCVRPVINPYNWVIAMDRSLLPSLLVTEGANISSGYRTWKSFVIFIYLFTIILWIWLLYCSHENISLEIPGNGMKFIPSELSQSTQFSLSLLRFTWKPIRRTWTVCVKQNFKKHMVVCR